MKTLNRVLLLSVMFFTSVIVSAQTENDATKLGNFKVEKATEKLTINNEAVETYVIQYAALDQPVYVAVVTEKNCENYIVRTNGFEIQYTCKKDKFGISYVETRFATLEKSDVMKKINRPNFLNQRVLSSSGPKPVDYQLSLIASYLPDVMIVG